MHPIEAIYAKLYNSNDQTRVEKIKAADDAYNSIIAFMKNPPPMSEDIDRQRLGELWSKVRNMILVVWADTDMVPHREEQIKFLSS